MLFPGQQNQIPMQFQETQVQSPLAGGYHQGGQPENVMIHQLLNTPRRGPDGQEQRNGTTLQTPNGSDAGADFII